MGAWGGSSVDIVVVAPGSRSVGRVLGDHYSMSKGRRSVKTEKKKEYNELRIHVFYM